MFNTRAKTYIAKLINNFKTSIYIPASLLLINIISGKAILLNFSKRIIIYITDIKEKIYILNLSKMQCLLNYSIKIFRVKKLLGRNNI